MINTSTTQLESMKRHYMTTWGNLLENLIGWRESQVRAWMKSAQETWDLDDSESWIYHERPSYWITETLIDDILPDISNTDYESLENQLIALLNSDGHDFTQSTNWYSYRNRVNKVLKDYGGKLPDLCSDPVIVIISPRVSSIKVTLTMIKVADVSPSSPKDVQLVDVQQYRKRQRPHIFMTSVGTTINSKGVTYAALHNARSVP